MSIFDDIRKDAEAGTPGPWSIRHGYKDVVRGSDGETVCHDEYGLMDNVEISRIARVPELERIALAAEELARWVNASLNCEAHQWDADQREIAEAELAAYREAIS